MFSAWSWFVTGLCVDEVVFHTATSRSWLAMGLALAAMAITARNKWTS